MTDPHEGLVRETTRVAFHTWDKFVHTPNVKGEPGLDRALRGFDLVARAVIALIAESTKDATPEMAEAWSKAGLSSQAGGDWSAMHRASALWPKEKL